MVIVVVMMVVEVRVVVMGVVVMVVVVMMVVVSKIPSEVFPLPRTSQPSRCCVGTIMIQLVWWEQILFQHQFHSFQVTCLIAHDALSSYSAFIIKKIPWQTSYRDNSTFFLFGFRDIWKQNLIIFFLLSAAPTPT